MACLWKHPACKNWFARFTGEEGRQINRSTGTSDRKTAQVLADGWAHAAKLARQGLMTADRARQVVNEILERTSYGDENLRVASVSEFFGNWLKTKCAAKTASTTSKYANAAKRFINHLGARASRPLTTVRTIDAQEYADERGKNTSSTTVSLDVKLLSAIFNHAQKQGVISKNPMSGVEFSKSTSLERSPFTPDQVASLVGAATEDWKTAVLVGFFTGARLGDAVNLNWSDINPTSATLSYRQKKTGEKAIVPIHPELLDHLKSLTVVPGGKVMPTLAGRATGGGMGLSSEFNKIMKSAGVYQPRIASKSGKSFPLLSFHSLRHGFESLLANSDVSSEVRRELTGRSTESSQQVYTHLEIQIQRKAVGMLPSVLGKK